MAYTSRAWVSGWKYDKSATDFNSKVGNLLAGGADIQATSVAAALAATRIPVQASTSDPDTATGRPPGHTSSSKQTCIGPHPGYAWVDEHGQALVMGPAASSLTTAVTQKAASDSTTCPHSGTNSCYSTMSATQRSMTIWKRVSPGMLPETSTTPQSTTAETHAYNTTLIEPVDFTHHLKKTDFAEYTEAALRGMQHIKAAAKK